MKHRIVQIIPTLDQGGAEKQLTLLATHLPRDEFDVHVCVLTRSGPLAAVLQQANIPVLEIRKRWKLDPAAYWRLRRALVALQPDLVHTWLFAANCYGRKAAMAARVPLIVAGERCVDRWKVWHEFAIDRYLARHTTCMVTNSQGVADFYAEQGIPPDKFEIIPNGIPSVPPGSDLSRAELLPQLGIPLDARLIGAVGRLWPQKRYKDLIWAAELLKVIRPDTHLLIIGEGPQRQILERFRANIGIQDRVHFLGHRDDASSILPHLDCYWIGSAYEGQSNGVMEAMLAGIPVVASDIPGNRDLIQHEQTGILFPLGDRAALAQATNLLLEDPDRARQLGEAGRQSMLADFSVEQMVSRHAELYRRLLA
jgi:glycosyltransferase involved in cell wall biosynthesis